MFSTSTKILIIDDMKTMRKIVAKALKDLGFENITESEDGLKGWEAISAPNADYGLVISDWNMPNGSGIDLLKKVRTDSRFAKLPFMLVTAESEKAQVLEALTVGVSAYVIKPFSMQTLQIKMVEAFKKVA
ncbi:hypothetical protein CIK05_01865 [Bdellovibrio sp. qaytius]|nr:hypothetical protein CIK05_01865 [Bdellovibrio sp. qaytius]